MSKFGPDDGDFDFGFRGGFEHGNNVSGATGGIAVSSGFSVDDKDVVDELDYETILIRAKLELSQGVNGHVPIFKLPDFDGNRILSFNREMLNDRALSNMCLVVIGKNIDGKDDVFLIRKEDVEYWRSGEDVALTTVGEKPRIGGISAYCIHTVMGDGNGPKSRGRKAEPTIMRSGHVLRDHSPLPKD